MKIALSKENFHIVILLLHVINCEINNRYMWNSDIYKWISIIQLKFSKFWKIRFVTFYVYISASNLIIKLQ